MIFIYPPILHNFVNLNFYVHLHYFTCVSLLGNDFVSSFFFILTGHHAAFWTIISNWSSRFNSYYWALEHKWNYMSFPIDVFLINLSTTSLRRILTPFVSICGLCHNCANYNYHIWMYMCIPRTMHLFVSCFFSR